MSDVPHSAEAEISVLGAMLIDAGAVSEVRSLLTPADFHAAGHRVLYETMAALYDRGVGLDVQTVAQALGDVGRLDEAGGWDFLGALVDAVPSAANARGHADIVRDKSRLRRLIATCGEVSRQAASGERAETVLQEAERLLLGVTERPGRHGFRSSGEVAMDAMALIERAAKTSDGMTGPRTGIPRLDRMTSGLEAGLLTILAGRPSMGKSALAWQVAERVAMDGHGVAYASYEMDGAQLGRRGLSRLSNIGAGEVRRGRLDRAQWAKLAESANRLAKLPLWTQDHPPHEVEGLRAEVRRHRTKHPVDLLVVDYLQLMAGPKGAQNRNAELQHITGALKNLARDMGVHVVALSQLNRRVEDRKPQRPVLSDLRDSGAIEQDADNVLLLWRPEYYFDDGTKDETEAKWQGKGELIVAKQRDGETGSILLAWDPRLLTFTELEQRHDGPRAVDPEDYGRPARGEGLQGAGA